MVHFLLSALLTIYTTITAQFCSVLCLLFMQLLKRIFFQCLAYYLDKFYSAILLSVLLLTQYDSAFLLSSFLITYRTFIVYFSSLPSLLFIQLL